MNSFPKLTFVAWDVKRNKPSKKMTQFPVRRAVSLRELFAITSTELLKPICCFMTENHASIAAKYIITHSHEFENSIIYAGTCSNAIRPLRPFPLLFTHLCPQFLLNNDSMNC